VYFKMFYFCLCQLCGIESGMERYELIQMVGIEWHVFSESSESHLFMGKVHTVNVGWFGGSMSKNNTGCVSG
jgi:hypothetical protein